MQEDKTILCVTKKPWANGKERNHSTKQTNIPLNSSWYLAKPLLAGSWSTASWALNRHDSNKYKQKY